MKLIKIKGFYTDLETIELENKKMINIKELTDANFQYLLFGTVIEFFITYDDHDFLSGKDGIVWASYDLRQLDIIKNALFAQNIISDVKIKNLGSAKIFLLSVNDLNDVSDAIDFIWKSKTGLQLKPDWIYPRGEKNKSFEQWLNGR